MEQKIDQLKKKLEKMDTRSVLGMIGIRFITFGNSGKDVAHNCDIFHKTELLSPQKQYLYLAGLLVSTSEPSTMATSCSEEDFAELEKDIQEITSEYANNFINTDFSVIVDPKQAEANLVSFEAFSSYFDTGILRYEEQTEQLIKDLYSPFDTELESLSKLRVDDYLEFYRFVSESFRNSYECARKEVTEIACFFDSLNSDSNNPNTEHKQMIDFVSGSRRERIQSAINGMSTVKISEILAHFGEEKGQILLECFSLKREKRNFTYYNGKNPFTQCPLCRIGDLLFIVHPQFLLNSIFNFITDTLEASGNSFADRYKKVKADIVEKLFLTHLKSIFGDDATYHTTVCEERGTKEHDILIEYGKYLIIAEIKASKVREPFFNPEKAFVRIHDHFHSDSGIGGAYKQAIVLKKKLEETDSLTLYENHTTPFTISNVSKRKILPLVLTLNQFGGLAINTSQILEKEDGQPYPWVCNLHDLENIIEINRYLNKSSSDFVDYIQWRIDHHKYLFASDELDLIESFYLNPEIKKYDIKAKVFFNGSGIGLIDKIYYEKKGIPFDYSIIDAAPKRHRKPSPNDPCPCGSGKKYKKCCRRKELFD